MKKLEDIPKKQVFEVPEGYFEKLPGIIQSRVTGHREERSWWATYKVALQFAVPAVILLAVGIFWFNRPGNELNAETILASIQTEDLVAYLDDVDITTDEVLEQIHFDNEDITNIEASVYEFPLSDSDYEEILDDLDNIE